MKESHPHDVFITREAPNYSHVWSARVMDWLISIALGVGLAAATGFRSSCRSSWSACWPPGALAGSQ